MKTTIHKFQLDVTEVQDVTIPGLVKLLTVQVQRGVPCIWALVGDGPAKVVRVTTMGTGHPHPDDIGAYFGTYQLHGGDLVFHVFVGLKS